MNNAVWITWENQRRNKTLSKALGIDLHQIEVNANRLIRYPILILKTLIIYVRNRPKYIFAQNPSIVLALLSVIYGRLLNKKVIIDAHNAGIYPLEGSSRIATRLAKFLFLYSDLTIVTNETLKTYVNNQGGNAAVLPDPFPTIEPSRKISLKGKFSFLLICTWASDEPYEEAIKAFASLDESYVLYITGNSKGKEQKLSFSVPKNVELTGYISDLEFDQLLQSCDCVIDLTTRDNCLVCGAYEAVAANKPLILSDSQALREYFRDSALYTHNTAESIAATVCTMASNLSEATQRTTEYRQQQTQAWNKMRNHLLAML